MKEVKSCPKDVQPVEAKEVSTSIPAQEASLGSKAQPTSDPKAAQPSAGGVGNGWRLIDKTKEERQIGDEWTYEPLWVPITGVQIGTPYSQSPSERIYRRRISQPKERFEYIGCAEERNWPEDFSHENGNYVNHCCVCHLQFMGHKRRVACRKCTEHPPEQPANEKQHELTEIRSASIPNSVVEKWIYDYQYLQISTDQLLKLMQSAIASGPDIRGDLARCVRKLERELIELKEERRQFQNILIAAEGDDLLKVLRGAMERIPDLEKERDSAFAEVERLKAR